MPEALTGSPRILNKLVDGFIGSSAGSTLSFGAYQGEGWDIIPAQAGGGAMFRWRGYIDLGGLEREALTFFMQSAQVVEASDILAQGSSVDIMDVFSKVEISDDDLNLPTSIQNLYSPGFNDSVQDMEQVLWCRSRNLYHDAGWSKLDMQQIATVNIWGEGIGTSASRLHLTRYVLPTTEEPKITIPPCVFQCVGTAVEEADLNYIMRLRRDYELAKQG